MLRIENVRKTFNPGTINEKIALDGVDLILNDGEFVTVIGSNGAGKSTLLNAIAGVWLVDEGKIFIDDIDVTKLSENKRARYIGRVFQDPMMGTAADMWIEENLALAHRRGKKRGLSPGIYPDERATFKALLKEFDLGLEDRLSTKVGLLSGGQRQALTLIMATLQSPRLLLLDEHTAALDPKTAEKVLDVTEKIVRKSGLTTFMVTHNMRDAIHHGDRLIMMNEGKIILDIRGEEKKKLTVEKLLEKFEKASGEEFTNDAAILG
ncbi:MAG: ABC transporter ATP-binding protein [Erysipelotrichaceae bacterium]|jgi:putative ABC transport system ATP-binding protein|nr:ABC transporter ATP-binding protein [Erysipelotrichaceae bacterium]